MKILMGFLFLFLLGLLTSCIEKPGSMVSKTVKSEITYHFEGGEDLPSLFSLSVSYANASGKLVNEHITALPWSRTVSAVLPFSPALNVAFSANESLPDKTLYTAGFNGWISYTTTDKQSGQITPPLTKTRAEDSDNKSFVLRVKVPSGADPSQVSMCVAPLKFDKHFAFTFTADDSYTNAYSQIWSRIHAQWIDDAEFHHLGQARTTGTTPDYALTMTDGCGNDRRFGFSCAIWPSWGNDLNATFVKDLSNTKNNSIYISWDELALLSDFGVSMLYHNVDERVWGKTDPKRIADGLLEDYLCVYRKLGVRMRVLGLPDGNAAYVEAAQKSGKVEFMRNALCNDLIYLQDCGSLKGLMTYGGNHTMEIAQKLTELAAQSAAERPYWVALTAHRPAADYRAMLEEIYRLYGKAGADNLWVASWDEIYEYVALREQAVITRRTEGQDVVFEVSLPDYEMDDAAFPELSFLVEGASGATVSADSENITGLSAAEKNGRMLVNVQFGSRLKNLAEKYTEAYEAAPDAETLDLARYFVGQLLPSLASEFEERLTSVATPGAGQLTPRGAMLYQKQYDGYVFSLSGDLKAK